MAWGAVDDSPQALGTITTCTLDTVAKGRAWIELTSGLDG